MLIAHTILLAVPFFRTFEYLLPDCIHAQVGCRVLVKFGKKKCLGIIASISDRSELPLDILKVVTKVLDDEPVFSRQLWKILLWASDYYHHPIGNVLFYALPALLRKGKSFTASSPALQKDWKNNYLLTCKPLQLNARQSTAANMIRNTCNNFIVWVLMGVTGCGKETVYLNVLEKILAQGKQALVMVPEIRFTLQTIAYFRKRFSAPIEVIHSKLNDTKRFDIWLKAKNGEVAIIIGTRSSLFTPFKKLGIIVICEEHDSSYKEQKYWRYHARDLAIYRARNEQIPIILVSATPSLATLYNVQQRKYRILHLTNRTNNIFQHILDLKGQLVQAGLTPMLITKMHKHLQAGNQVILFLNRRGFASALICHNCTWIAQCPDCDHYCKFYMLQNNYLNCSHCHNKTLVPSECPVCDSINLIPVGFGTEQLEQVLPSFFSGIPILRIDGDTSKHKGGLNLNKKFSEVNFSGPSILIGTQMLTNRYSLTNATLVALLDIDNVLFSADFRSAERFAQLYIQIIGEVKRGNTQGEVVVQTYHPEHHLLRILLYKGYYEFAKQALIEREALKLPPLTTHIIIRSEDNNNKWAPLFLKKLRSLCEVYLRDDKIWILGPIPSSVPKRKGRYRWQLLLQHPSRAYLHDGISSIIAKFYTLPEARRVKWALDVDPIEN